MNKIFSVSNLFLIKSFILSSLLFGQPDNSAKFDSSATCHVNANGRNWANPYYNSKNASVKLRLQKKANKGGGAINCSATLLNQVTELGQLKRIIALSSHCIREGDEVLNLELLGSIDVDFNSDQHQIYFNYQSPDAASFSTPLNNRGLDNRSSNLLLSRGRQEFEQVNDGYRYTLTTRLNRLAENAWGDYVLLEIVEDIPPHFLPYYSGYQTNAYPIALPSVGFHHPKGDIKKLVNYPALAILDQ
jgi:hypothetical protein